jgi:hypothetical protein
MTAEKVSAFTARVASLLRAEGRTEAADEVVAVLRTPRREKPALFVVGEDKNGKSYLVNALLGEPDLSPVGVEVVTGAPITFFRAAQRTALVYRYGEAQPEVVDFEEARQLATVAGNPRNINNVRAVALGVDSPLLDGFNLVDTPGVGGLASGHGALTIQSLRSADAMIFAIEAGAQFRAPELEFLRRAAERIDTVILALTKIDAHRGWRTIKDDNRAILEEQAPRFAGCPLVPVSSVLALRVLETDDPDEADALRNESGLSLLKEAIAEHVVARSAVLADANVVWQATNALSELERTLREQAAALTVDRGAREALEAERARLQGLRADRAEWPRRLSGEMQKLSLERSEAVTRGTLEIKGRYDERVRHAAQDEFDVLPGELIAELTALAGSLNESATERLTELVGEVLGDIDHATALKHSIGELSEHSLRDELSAVPVGDYAMTPSDKVAVLMSFISGRSVASMGGAAAGALLTGPVGMLFGFGAGGVIAFQAFRVRKQQAFSVAFQSWMQAQITRTQLTVTSGFSRAMLDLQTQLRDQIQAALDKREREISESLASAEGLLRAESSDRSAAQSNLDGRVKAVLDLKREASALLVQMGRPLPPEPSVSTGAPSVEQL